MSKIKSISIPQPCSQSWQRMEVREQGRYCQACTKTVIDFSTMANDEILVYLATAKNVCGRFSQTQLSNLNHLTQAEESETAFSWKRWIVAAGLITTAFVNKAGAQTSPAYNLVTEQTPKDSAGKDVAQVDSTGAKLNVYRIFGQVIGADDKLPVVGASVRIKDAEVGAVTDVNGCFELSLQTPKAILIVSYIGYETSKLKVSFAKNGQLNVVLKVTPSVSGELVITRESRMSRTEMLFQYMPWPINRLFK